MDPKELRFAPTHEWAHLSNGILTLGVTAFAAEQLGDVTLVDMKKPGTRVGANESCGEIESVKSVNDVYTPIAGEIVETNNEAVNKMLGEDSKALASDPYGQCWLVRLRVAPGAALDMLMDYNAYEQHLAAEGH
jgi:glycine cleavage system H protein